MSDRLDALEARVAELESRLGNAHPAKKSITSCVTCGSCDTDYDRSGACPDQTKHFCTHPGATHNRRPLDRVDALPDWCPLPKAEAQS